MPKTALERAYLLREAAAYGRRYPDDLFEARMAVHEALGASGVNTYRICDLLLSKRPPLDDGDCIRLELIASLIDAEPAARGDDLLGLCEMALRMVPF
ncbi:hypothetical protein CSV86_014535 [Pseudomonas putida CSV86]|uniref:Uncharacterized protein n=1 Tax=Pseudomonas bharatica CSV86 TaxID=1005395 RepID=L1LVZ4_9PSED|nr:hypothetical protein [Pseudomonas bharatica]NNJ16343.1 hypothetical protein [Pseudomonas bharatica CSV86]